MGRKPRITAVPVDQVFTQGSQDQREQKEEGLMVARDVPDQKTDAEQMTEILQEVKEEPNAEEQKAAVSDAPVVVKPKAKRASRAKPKEEPVKEEPKEEPKKEEPIEEPKCEDKVECTDCGKQMSAKTLKYSHGPNCSSKKPNKKADERQPTIQREEITEELIEHHIRTRTRADRALRRETMMNKLMQTAF